MVINLVGVLVKSTKRIDLVVSAIGNGGIDKTCGSLTESSGDLGSVAVHHRPVLHWGVWHDEGIIGRRDGRRSGGMRQRLRLKRISLR